MTQFFDAFISYGRADSKAFATKLYNCLHDRGFEIWFDQNDIPLGVDFQNQIDDGIEKAHNFLFIIAPHSVNSPYCGKEIELALRRNKRIIPLLHVEQIDQEIWQQRKPQGTDEEWEAYKATGLHSSFNNMHPAIGKINWVYFREGIDDFEKSLAGLTELLNRHKDYVDRHTQILAKALEWERQQKQHRWLLVGDEKKQAEAWLKIRFKDEQPPCTPTDLHCEYITESIKNGNNLMTQVFVSYAEEDRSMMEKIRNSLRRKSLTVWTNKTDIQIGETWEEAIRRGIEQADNVVYLLSPDSIDSYEARTELEIAVSLNKRIIPVLVREISTGQMPEGLRELQYIDLTDNVAEDDYLLDESQLLKILYQDEDYYNEHKILLAKALKWQRQSENPSILLRGYNLRSAEAWLKVAQMRSQHRPTPLQEAFIAASLRQPPAESLDVFISYSRADSDLARKLNEALQLQGKTTWFDQESIASGTDFAEEIKQGIRASDNFLFILSPRSVKSPYCAQEVEYAAALKKRFVTVLHQPIEPTDLHPELAKVQWIDFAGIDRDFNANFNQLVRTIDTDRDHLRSHTKWSQRSLEWEEDKKKKDLLLRGSELAVAEAWLKATQAQKKQPAATELQKTYIARSGGYQHQNRRLLTGTVMGVMGVVTAFWLRAEGIATIATLRESAARAQLLLPIDPVEALILAIQETDESRSSLFTLQKVLPPVQSILRDAIGDARERNLLQGHEGEVISVAFSPDGKTIVSSGDDGTIRLWDPSGNPIGQPFKGHEGWVNSVAFSPDGKTIVSGGKDGTIRLWDPSGNPIGQPFKGHENWVYSVAFSPDGKTIVSGDKDGTIRLWRGGKWLDWLKVGCDRLIAHPIFVTPETFLKDDTETISVAKEAAQTCQKFVWNDSQTAQFLSHRGRATARQGEIQGAMKLFQQAHQLSPNIQVPTEEEVGWWAAGGLVESGEKLAREGQIEEAVQAYHKAQQLKPTWKLYADSWHTLCRSGIQHQEVAQVMDACERAVALAPNNGAFLESRAIAKALMKDYPGAIEDLQASLGRSDSDEEKQERQRWIDALKKSENPFTKEEIEKL